MLGAEQRCMVQQESQLGGAGAGLVAVGGAMLATGLVGAALATCTALALNSHVVNQAESPFPVA